MRYANVVIGGMFAGLAGAYFTIESVPSFEPLLTNGRGFISLAAMISATGLRSGLGRRRWFWRIPSLADQHADIPRCDPPQWSFLQESYIVGLTPYILTMFILTGIIGRTTPPAADGVAYEK